MRGDSVEVEVDASDLKRVGAALRAQGDAKPLRKALIAELKAAVAPGVSAVKSRLESVPNGSGLQSSPALGAYLASRVTVQVRLGGRAPGVAVKIRQTPQLRGFRYAARRLNRDGWRHPVFGRDVWVEQTSPIRGYFDDALQADREQYRAAVLTVLERTARMLAARH